MVTSLPIDILLISSLVLLLLSSSLRYCYRYTAIVTIVTFLASLPLSSSLPSIVITISFTMTCEYNHDECCLYVEPQQMSKQKSIRMLWERKCLTSETKYNENNRNHDNHENYELFCRANIIRYENNDETKHI